MERRKEGRKGEKEVAKREGRGEVGGFVIAEKGRKRKSGEELIRPVYNSIDATRKRKSLAIIQARALPLHPDANGKEREGRLNDKL